MSEPAPRVLYTDHDAKICAWLGELVRQGHLAPGRVLPADIATLTPADCAPYDRVHLFAGIGGWQLAAQLADWPADLPLWTGSCPCQPFSSAGKGRGERDPRHLWPQMCRLVADCRPPVVAGEQVASPAGRAWLAAVRADLESLGYAVGTADLPAASVGAPHLRQRLWWVALADGIGIGQPRQLRRRTAARPARRGGANGGMADAMRGGREEQLYLSPSSLVRRSADEPVGSGADAAYLVDPDRDGVGRMAHAAVPRQSTSPEQREASQRATRESRGSSRRMRSGVHHGGWGAADWFRCRDAKWRPAEPGTFPLAHGLPARVVRLRGYGNAIVPQVGAAFLASVLDLIAPDRETGRAA